MLIIAGQIRVKEDERDDYVTDCEQVVRAARASKGCLDFAITADTLEAGRINVYERWQDEGTLLAFRGSGPSSDQQTQILDASVRRYVISDVQDP
jgi:quinol monooxygenase YgiN